jgi:pyruvate/2-oxoglutarate dehydrogenase complex dihydrolipoamide acyltransferase (E2) component
MAFKLTFLLVGLIFIVMYFAQDRDPITAAREPESQETQQEAAAPEAPQESESVTPPAPSVEPRTAAPAARTPVAPPARVQPGPEIAQTPDPAGTDRTEERGEALSTLTLQRLDLGSDTGAAISLADRVRARREATASGPTAAPAETAGQMFEVTGNSVNLRSGPSPGDPVMGRVFAGDRVRVLETMPSGWSRIQHPETGGEVYMSSNFLRPAAN